LELTEAGLGQSIGVSIGSDYWLSFLQWLQILDEDETTQAIVLVGEPGGNSEESASTLPRQLISR